MKQVVPEGMKCPVNVRPLPACVAIVTGQLRAAIQAVLFMRMAVFAGAGSRLDGPRQDRTARCVTDRFEIRHDQSPFPDIMRGPALMLAPRS